MKAIHKATEKGPMYNIVLLTEQKLVFFGFFFGVALGVAESEFLCREQPCIFVSGRAKDTTMFGSVSGSEKQN